MRAVRLKPTDLRRHPELLPGAAGVGTAESGPAQPGAVDHSAPVRPHGGRGNPKGRRPRFRLKATEPRERDILPGVLMALAMHPRVKRAYRMNTGAGRLIFADQTKSQFIRFGPKGSPDIHGWLTDGTALFVECKRPTGRIRPEQAKWIDEAREAGCVAFVARGVECVKENLG